MSDAQLERIERLFFTAAELSTASRRLYLDVECADEPELRQRVERMLDAGDDDSFITGAISGAARQASAEPASAWVGREVGPYRITGALGYGGMGTVYAAERADGTYDATVAIKIIRGAMAGADTVRRFRAERKILGGLAHPNIARLLDAGRTDDGVPYMVMEHVDGVPIDRYCDEHCLTIDERVELFERVCAAVWFAHRAFVVHRDLKPANILVTQAGEPKLLDFGIAKLLDAGDEWPTRTASSAALMTPAYASPEQLLGRPITTATDVYGLGLVLYEILTGVLAHEFTDRSPREVERVVCHDMPPSLISRYPTHPSEDTARRARLRNASLKQLRRTLNGDVRTIVETALRKEPERRYASVDALMDDLRRSRQGLPIAARTDTLGYRIRRFVGRHPVGVATAAAVTLLLVAAGAAVVMQGVRAARERDMAEIRRQVAAGVSEFLVAAPTTPDVLARGEERIAALEGQPAVQAGVMAAVGQLYYRAGLVEAAGAQLEAALAQRLALFGPDAGEVAASHQALGDLRLDAGAVDRAVEHYREALRIRTALEPPGHPDRLETRLALARAAAAGGDWAGAESAYRTMLPEVQDELMRAQVLYDLAELFVRAGNTERARALADSAFALRAVLAPEHPVRETSRVQRLRLASRSAAEPFTPVSEQRIPSRIPTPIHVASGDFDGDGRLDLVWNHRSARTNAVHVAFGTPEGGFRPAAEVAQLRLEQVQAWDAFWLRVGDFDGDGRDDLLWNRLADRNQWVAALSDGTGGFRLAPQGQFGFGPTGLVWGDDDGVDNRWSRRGLLIADLTGDGMDDLFWYDDRLLSGWIAVASGGGRFEPIDVGDFFPYGPAAAVGYDVGEHIDAAVAARGPRGMRIVRGRWEAHNEVRVDAWDAARGRFRTPRVLRYDHQPYYMYNSVGTWHYYIMRAGDVDGDGLDDLVWVDPATPFVPANTGNRVYVARATRGDPPFVLDLTARQDSLTLGDPGPFDVHLADVNDDGRADLLWERRTPAGENRLYVSFGTPDARFDPRPAVFLHPEGGDWTRSVMFVGDVNGDGRADLVWNRSGALNRVHVALGR